MERCPSQVSVEEMRSCADATIKAMIDTSRSTGGILELIPMSEQARESFSFLLNQLRMGPQAAIVALEGGRRLILFEEQARLWGCIATCVP